MSAVATDTVTISLEVGCSDECDRFAKPLYEQLSGGGYDHCSVLEIPDDIDEWVAERRTARKRAWRAERLGYEGAVIHRRDYEDDVYAVNTSAPERQGRPMSPGYLARPVYGDDTSRCERHGVHAYGVLGPDGHLRAYLWMYRAGDLALVSSILGHAEHLANDVMYLLFSYALEGEILAGPGICVYNRHDSGGPGLRYYKERCGLRGADVEWQP